MYYVVRSNEGLENYHWAFEDISQAKEAALRLKNMFHHEYAIIKVESVWTTQTLADIMEE